MVRRALICCLAAGSCLCSIGGAAAQRLRPKQRYELVTTLPTTSAPRILARDDPRLLVHELGLDVRTLWLSPGVELTLVQGTKLLALDVIGWGNVSFTPTSFGGGTLSLSAPF